MKILFISDLWTPFPGGAEYYIANLAMELQNRGNQVHVLTGYHTARQPGIRITAKSIDDAKTITDFIQEVKPDCLFTHHHFAHFYEEAIFGAGLPVFQLVHSRPRIARAALAIFNSQYTADRNGHKEGDMIILPPAGQNIVAPTHGDLLGMVKPLAGKGIDFLYRIAYRMQNRKFLVLRGEWQDIEDIRWLPNVEFMEPVNDMRDFYSRVRVMLMPSESEDAGTIPQEAALNGLPCVSTPVGGLPETNKGGIIIPKDEELWMAAIEKLDDVAYYREVVDRQKAYVDSLDWHGKFDKLNGRMREIVNV